MIQVVFFFYLIQFFFLNLFFNFYLWKFCFSFLLLLLLLLLFQCFTFQFKLLQKPFFLFFTYRFCIKIIFKMRSIFIHSFCLVSSYSCFHHVNYAIASFYSESIQFHYHLFSFFYSIYYCDTAHFPKYFYDLIYSCSDTTLLFNKSNNFSFSIIPWYISYDYSHSISFFLGNDKLHFYPCPIPQF